MDDLCHTVCVISKGLNLCEQTVCDEVSVLWWCVQQEVVTECTMMLVMMSLLTRLWEIVTTKGACFSGRMGTKGFSKVSGS